MLIRADSTYHHYVYAGYWLTICAGVFIILILVSMYLLYPGGYPDPFTFYEGIMPGQPAGALDGFGCYTDYPPSSQASLHCPILREDDIIFSRIQALAYEGEVKQITFYGSTLQVVDLMKHFGEPESITLGKRHYIIKWDNGTFALIPIGTHRFVSQMHVLSVSLRS